MTFKRLIDFMRHAGGHGSERRHLPGLNELGLFFHTFGNIAGRCNDHITVIILERTNVDINVNGLAVFAIMPLFGKQKRLPFADLLQPERQFFVIIPQRQK